MVISKPKRIFEKGLMTLESAESAVFLSNRNLDYSTLWISVPTITGTTTVVLYRGSCLIPNSEPSSYIRIGYLFVFA